MKKAQITLFMILGIVIIAIFITLFFVTGIGARTISDIDEAQDAVQVALESCLAQTTDRALELIGLQGTLKLENSFQYQNTQVHYAFNLGNNAKKAFEIQEEMESYINEHLPTCTNELIEDFDKMGVIVQLQAPASRVILGKADVTAQLTLPTDFRLKGGDDRRSLSRYTQSYTVRLAQLLEVAQRLSTDATKHPGYINLTYLESIDFQTTIMPYEDGTNIFLVEDIRSKLRNRPYVYSFAIKDVLN